MAQTIKDLIQETSGIADGAARKAAYLRSIFIILSIYFLLPAALILFNYAVDPYERYHSDVTREDLTRLSRSEELILSIPKNYNDRALLERYVRIIPKPRTVVMGGSRVMNLRLEGGAEQGFFLNAGVSSGTIKDYIGIWQILKENGKTPERLLLCIDPQSLYQKNGVLWYSLSGAYLRFQRGRTNPLSYVRLATDVLWEKLNFHLSQLVSSETTRASLEKLGAQKNRSALLTGQDRSNLASAARDSGFTLLYPASAFRDSQESIDRLALQNGQGESYTFKNWNVDRDTFFEDLAALVHDIRASGTRITMVLMPAHPLSYQTVRNDPDAYGKLQKYLNRLAAIARAAGVPLLDGLEEKRSLVRNQDFMDGVHLKPAENRRFFRGVLERSGS